MVITEHNALVTTQHIATGKTDGTKPQVYIIYSKHKEDRTLVLQYYNN